MKRYLLCRPTGGFNDTLVQISWCVDYALRFGRELILDTTTSGIGCDFDELFKIEELPVEVTIYSSFRERDINQLSTWPACVQGRINTYDSVGQTGKIGLYEAETLQKLSFSRNFDYPQQLLVHHGGGGGTSSKHLLPFLNLQEGLRAQIVRDLKQLPSDYDAVHIRNTDYPSAWERILSRVARKSDRRIPVVVFSDDIQVLKSAPTLDRFFVPSPIRRSHGVDGPLHKQERISKDSRRELAVEMITELAAMSRSRNFYYARTRGRNGSPKSPVSGFSSLVVSSRIVWPDGNPFLLTTESQGSLRGKSVRLRLVQEELRALIKFLVFYYRRGRSGLGKQLGR